MAKKFEKLYFTYWILAPSWKVCQQEAQVLCKSSGKFWWNHYQNRYWHVSNLANMWQPHFQVIHYHVWKHSGDMSFVNMYFTQNVTFCIFMPSPLGAGGIMFSGCPSVHPSVRPSVRLKPGIPSFDLYMGPLVHLTNRDRFTACLSVCNRLYYWKINCDAGRSMVLLEDQLYWRQWTGLDGNYRSRKITARRWLHKYVGAECGASSFT